MCGLKNKKMKRNNKQSTETDKEFLRRVGLWSDGEKGIKKSNVVTFHMPYIWKPGEERPDKKTKVVEVIKKK
jgi:hypothetical protein